MSSSSSETPPIQTAIIQGPEGRLQVVHDAPIPAWRPRTILVETIAVALNPYDYKMPSRFPMPGAFSGSDFVGKICSIDEEVGDLQLGLATGDIVCGCVYSYNPEAQDVGSFAQYVRAPAELVYKINPLENIRSEEAATFGAGLATLCLALWYSDALALTQTPVKPLENASTSPVFVLVYGGSTATGTLALQLLKLSGYIAIAICSPKNFSLAKSYGARHVFDYKDPTSLSTIRELTSHQMQYALDCITDNHSVEFCHAALGRAGGHLVTLEPLPEPSPGSKRRKAVKHTFVDGHEIFGEGIPIDLPEYARKVCPEKHRFARQWVEIFQKLIWTGTLRAHPVHLLEGGFEAIIDGLKLHREGSVSGKKLVVRLGKNSLG